MIASAHLAVGAAGGRFLSDTLFKANSIVRVITAFFLGILTHIFLDTFPHGEYLSRWPWPLVIAETLIVFTLVFIQRSDWPVRLTIFASMAGAAFPDLLSRIPNPMAHNIGTAFHGFHDAIHIGFDISTFLQIFLAAIAIIMSRRRLA